MSENKTYTGKVRKSLIDKDDRIVTVHEKRTVEEYLSGTPDKGTKTYRVREIPGVIDPDNRSSRQSRPAGRRSRPSATNSSGQRETAWRQKARGMWQRTPPTAPGRRREDGWTQTIRRSSAGRPRPSIILPCRWK